MTDPTTRIATPPQSSRIAQQAPTNAVILPAYTDVGFPGVAFSYQLAIDIDTNTLRFYNTNGAWQGILSAADVQTFYGPVTPTTTGVYDGDRWYNTATGIWHVWSEANTAWMPGDVAFSTQPPATPAVGDTWFDTANQVLKFWDGSAWVLGGAPTAPGSYTGAFPNGPVVEGSRWTDSFGVQFVCTTAYAAAMGTRANWTQITIGADPLVNLIQQNGQLIQAVEQTPGTITAGPSVPVGMSVTTGLVWLNTTPASTYEGDYFVYTGTYWQQVINPGTLVLCAGLKVSQNAPGIVGTNLNYIWPDDLAALVTLNSSFVSGTGSAVPTDPGPVVSSAITAVQLTSNVARITVSTLAGFISGRTITVSGLTTTALNGTHVITEIDLPNMQIVFDKTNANIAPTADSGTATLVFQIGDVALDEPENEWFVFTADTPTGDWVDWENVTNPSTVELCATIATQVLPSLISQRCIQVGQDVATGQYQNVPSDLNAALLDVLALADATYQPMEGSLSNYVTASQSYQQNSVLYFVGIEQPVLANVSPLGTSLMNTASSTAAQALISVTDQAWTGSDTKIQAANFLTTYTTARGTLL